MSESYQRLRKFTEIRSANYRSRPGTIETVHEYVGPDAVAHDLLEHDLEQVVAEHAAVMAELDRLRSAADEIQAVNARLTGYARQLRHAYRSGWDERGADITAAMDRGGFHKAEAAAKAYVDRVRAGAAGQQPEGGSDADGAQ